MNFKNSVNRIFTFMAIMPLVMDTDDSARRYPSHEARDWLIRLTSGAVTMVLLTLIAKL